jgi:outer membrane protein OmpA-like peptidoglycan-associated protein
MKYKCVIGMMVFAVSCLAQEAPKADLFLGYSFLRANSARNIPAFTANGGAGTIAWNLNNHFGLEAEFGGYHNGNIHDVQFDTTVVTYLFGPRVSYGRTKTVSPYGHILFGGMHFMSSIATTPTPTPVSTTSTGRLATSQDAFTMALGGGLDVRVSKTVSIRPIQLDWVMSRLQDLGMSGTPSQNRNQHHLRYAAGIVFSFGGERPEPALVTPANKPCPDGSSVAPDQDCPKMKLRVSLTSNQAEVCPGLLVRVALSVPLPAGAEPEWSVNGEPITRGPTFDFGSVGRTPGLYKVSLRVAAPGYEEASADTTINVLGYKPPSGRLQISSPEIWVGEKATLSADFIPGQCGGKLGPVGFTASEGSVQGNEYDSSSLQFDPSDRSEQRKTVSISANVSDEVSSATAQTAVVVKKRAALTAKRLPDIVFPRNSARVNNCGKRVLLEVLKTYLSQDPAGKVVLVGHLGGDESTRAGLDRGRALNAAAVISAGQGICTAFPPSQVLVSGVGTASNGVDFQPHFCGTSTEVRTAERAGQALDEADEKAKERRVEVWFVPAGGLLPTSASDYSDAAALSVATLGCPK